MMKMTKKTKKVTCKTSGKIMLAGEYNVLQGGRALATTIDRFLTVQIEENSQKKGFSLVSDLWEKPLHVLPESQTFQTFQKIEKPFVEAVRFASAATKISGGTLSVHSELDLKAGVGSSSALRLGVLLCFYTLKNLPAGRYDLHNCASFGMLAEQAYHLQKEGQNSLASGYDILTQLVGGFFIFQSSFWQNLSGIKSESDEIDQDFFHEYFHIFYGGKGAETKTVTTSTWDWLKENQKLSSLEKVSEDLVESILSFLRSQDREGEEKKSFERCLEHIVLQRKFFETCPRFPLSISKSLSQVVGFDRTWTYKTTGAGGEDALILFGQKKDTREAEIALKNLGWKPYPGKAKKLCAEVIVEES